MSSFDKEQLKLFFYWITERESIRLKKEAGKKQPWTKDPILAKYRFCCVDRNDDAVTRWIHQNWLNPYSGDPHAWFAMVVARLLNLPSTLEVLEAPLRHKKTGLMHWDAGVFVATLHALREKQKIFNAAYIVSTNGRSMDKVNYLADRVLTPMWEKRHQAAKHMDSLAEFHKWLMTFDGMGSFMAAQVVADLKYDTKSPLNGAPDFNSWAASGPGSRRGMRRLMGGPAEGGFPERGWAFVMNELWALAGQKFAKNSELRRKLTAQNLQNCLCEFDKYMRVKNGEGEPKQLYRSKA